MSKVFSLPIKSIKHLLNSKSICINTKLNYPCSQNIILQNLIKILINFIYLLFSVNTDNLKLRVNLRLPQLLINGTYEMNGNIFLSNITGKGPFYSIFC